MVIKNTQLNKKKHIDRFLFASINWTTNENAQKEKDIAENEQREMLRKLIAQVTQSLAFCVSWNWSLVLVFKRSGHMFVRVRVLYSSISRVLFKSTKRSFVLMLINYTDCWINILFQKREWQNPQNWNTFSGNIYWKEPETYMSAMLVGFYYTSER